MTGNQTDTEYCKAEVDQGNVTHACEHPEGDGHLEHECACGTTWHEEATC